MTTFYRRQEMRKHTLRSEDIAAARMELNPGETFTPFERPLLTKEEITKIMKEHFLSYEQAAMSETIMRFARAIEQATRSKM